MKTRRRNLVVEISIVFSFVSLLASCLVKPSTTANTPFPTNLNSQSHATTPPLEVEPTITVTPIQDIEPMPNRLRLGNSNWYILGINYPWLNYGHDFGTTAWGHDGVSSSQSAMTVASDFSFLESQRAHVVRWFLFTDGRASPEFDADGKVTGFDEYFYEDVDTALDMARKHDLYIIFVLFDFHIADKAEDVNGVQVGGRSQIITDPEKQKTFLDNALKPLLEKYGNDNTILAWEVINEPEGAMDIPDGRWVDESVSAEVMQAFVNKVVNYIHTYSTQYATVGSASRRWLSYWTDSNLDFYQYHYYDNMEDHYPLDFSYENLKLDKPCIVGEFPTKNSNRTLTQFLDVIWDNGYAGALAWSYKANDDKSDFGNIANELKDWSEAHQDDVQIDSPR